MRVVSTQLVHVPSPRAAVIEVQLVEDDPPRRWRRWIAVKLLRLAGRLARMRVRIVQ